MCVCLVLTQVGSLPQASTEVAAWNEFLPCSRSHSPPPSQPFRGAVKGKPWGWPQEWLGFLQLPIVHCHLLCAGTHPSLTQLPHP